MTLDSFLSRARYLALALPLFALFSTVQGGCITGTSRYGYGAPGSSGTASSDCTSYGGYGGYAGYGGYGGYAGYAGDVSYTHCYGTP
jgi:hypothetical protein